MDPLYRADVLVEPVYRADVLVEPVYQADVLMEPVNVRCSKGTASVIYATLPNFGGLGEVKALCLTSSMTWFGTVNDTEEPTTVLGTHLEIITCQEAYIQ